MIDYRKIVEDDENQQYTEHTWYNSSNVAYSKVTYEYYPTGKKTDLFVVFKRGAQYKYIDVDFDDYTCFSNSIIGSDLTLKSAGKALTEHLKKRGYEYERHGDVNLNDLYTLKATFKTEDEKERESELSFNERVDNCSGFIVNGVDVHHPDYLIERYGQEVYDEANERVTKYFESLQ